MRKRHYEVLCQTVRETAFKVSLVVKLVAQEASERLGVPFGIVDLSLAPTPSVGDSVAEILEEMGLESAGAPGTTAALALLYDQVKKGGVMASSIVGGLSGAFIPSAGPGHDRSRYPLGPARLYGVRRGPKLPHTAPI